MYSPIQSNREQLPGSIVSQVPISILIYRLVIYPYNPHNNISTNPPNHQIKKSINPPINSPPSILRPISTLALSYYQSSNNPNPTSIHLHSHIHTRNQVRDIIQPLSYIKMRASINQPNTFNNNDKNSDNNTMYHHSITQLFYQSIQIKYGPGLRDELWMIQPVFVPLFGALFFLEKCQVSTSLFARRPIAFHPKVYLTQYMPNMKLQESHHNKIEFRKVQNDFQIWTRFHWICPLRRFFQMSIHQHRYSTHCHDGLWKFEVGSWGKLPRYWVK